MFVTTRHLRSFMAGKSPLTISKFAAFSQATNGVSLKEGDRVPHVIFKARVRDNSLGGENPFKWKEVSTKDLFENKRVVIFALPGGQCRI